MKKLILFICFIALPPYIYASENSSLQQKNIELIKNMFSEFADKRDISKLDNFYSKDFTMESNGQHYNYQEFKNVEQSIFKKIKNQKDTYHDIFATSDKVVSRMTIKLTHQDGKIDEYQVILIALIKDNKIAKIWEVTYPDWSKAEK